MWARGPRGGPSRSTPAGVQCQKCLQRGHYSYECKSAPQERPYRPRPSRTQQLVNPKLAPKLNSDVPDAFQKRIGVADEELAKKEAERVRQQKALDDDCSDHDSASERDSKSRRRRSLSDDSGSTISTRSGASTPSRRRSGRDRTRSPSSQKARVRNSFSGSPSRSRSSAHSRSQRRPRSYSRSITPDKSRYANSPSPPFNRRMQREDSLSPRRDDGQNRIRERSSRRYDSEKRTSHRHERDSRSPRRNAPSHGRARAHGGDRNELDHRQYRQRDAEAERSVRPRSASPLPRERSLSPFSKRLALTKEMNSGR